MCYRLLLNDIRESSRGRGTQGLLACYHWEGMDGVYLPMNHAQRMKADHRSQGEGRSRHIKALRQRMSRPTIQPYPQRPMRPRIHGQPPTEPPQKQNKCAWGAGPTTVSAADVTRRASCGRAGPRVRARAGLGWVAHHCRRGEEGEGRRWKKVRGGRGQLDTLLGTVFGDHSLAGLGGPQSPRPRPRN